MTPETSVHICGAAFLVSVLLFLLYFYNNFGFKEEKKPKPQKPKTPAKPLYINGTLRTAEQKAADPEPRKEWKTPERLQQEEEYHFFNDRIHTLEAMREATLEAETKAEAKVAAIYEVNQYGVVVNDRSVKRAENELYTVQQKRLRVENQLQTARRGRSKALQSMTKAG